MLIGLAGKMRTGKDTVADHLVKEYNFTRVGLADPIKAAVAAIMGMSVEEAEEYGREKPIPWLNNTTFRIMWQTLGTEWGRNLIDEDIWLKLAAKHSGNIVISDIRFENEASFVRKNNGLIIHIDRKVAPEDSVHTSESGITKQLGSDLLITNNGSLADLYIKVNRIMHGEGYSFSNI